MLRLLFGVCAAILAPCCVSIALAAPALPRPSTFQSAADETLAFRDLEAAWILECEAPGVRVLRTVTAWEQFWKQNNGSPFGIPAPRLNFQDSMLVVVYWGVHTGCANYVHAIRSIVLKTDATEVDVGPLVLMPCTLTIYPIQVAVVRRVELPTIFIGDTPATSVEAGSWGRIKSLYPR